jgi:hypothetical protein
VVADFADVAFTEILWAVVAFGFVVPEAVNSATARIAAA